MSDKAPKVKATKASKAPNKKKAKPKYDREVGEKVARALHEMKRGELKSGRSGEKVTDPKQAIAIGISEAKRDGARAPEKA
jgi:hypothetical protein